MQIARILIPTLLVSVFPATLNASTISFTVDNDGLFGTDYEYTNGFFLRWSSELDTQGKGYSLELGSQIWTPSLLVATEPLPNERPYAGVLNISGQLYQQTPTYLLQAGGTLGLIGPSSGSAQGQSFVHKLVGSVEPSGWDYQISDEFIYQLNLKGHQLLHRSMYGEIGVYGQGQLGNFQNEIGVGLSYRYGLDLENTFGSTSSRPGNTLDAGLLSNSYGGGFFVFLNLEQRYRFSDITIEGEKPAGHFPITLRHNQSAISLGMALYGVNWGAAIAMTSQSSPFTEADYQQHSFASLTLFYRY